MALTRSDTDNRPDPDALLALSGGGRGRLTLFLGAAPGVGKTFAMLTRARRVKADKVDIVIGLVETHGRAETAALLDELEILPRRTVAYQGRMVEEFDLDAALKRRPRIIVVDEMAHTNAPDSRHPKRFLDIEELLAAGIDVWSAMNIQHLESLSDIVTQITGVPVRERVPDMVLSRADDVLLVDISPTDLIERLKQGKVYLPGNAERAAENFFRIGNLTALREMALRRTADRVDDQVIDFMRQNAIEEAWPSGERLIVCIGPDALSERVVRTAARLATGLNAPWIVVSVERADQPDTDAAAASRLAETFKLAESLGAETRRFVGSDFVEEILKLARREHATQIVIGARRQRALARWLKTSLTDALVERVAGIAVHIVTDESDEPAPRRPAPAGRWQVRWQALAIAAISVSAATLLGLAIDRLVDLPNLSLLYIVAVLVSAINGGAVGAVVAALTSALAYNFFFIDPIGTFEIAQPHEVFGLVIFIVAAILAGGLASRVTEQARAARDRAAATQALYDFSRKLSGTAKADDVVWAAVTQLQASLRRGIAVLLPQGGELSLAAAWPPETELDVTDATAARWAFDKREAAGDGTGTLPNSAYQFRPLHSPAGAVGVIGYARGAEPLDADGEKVLGAILDQTGIAMDRARLSRQSLDNAARQEGERFRSALLSSISHDLKTPLATITGAVTSLRELGGKMTPSSRADLLLSIEEESDRLSRFVANLLDMTRIDAGTVDAKRDWVDVADVIRATLERVAKYFPGRTIHTSIARDLPPVRGDSVLLGQVLFNLLDNAIKYGGGEPPGIFARHTGSNIAISITDLGPGIPARDLARIFEKFFRRNKVDGRTPGTGLGLAISKGFVEAMGGTIRAESPAQRRRGTRITLTLPVESRDAVAAGNAA